MYEANPLANWWLSRHGWLGMASFKAAVVLAVVGLTAVLARSRPRMAGSVLGLVVLYSLALCRPTLLSAHE